MDKLEQAAIVDVERLNIDNVNVASAGSKDHFIQNLNALTPLLTVLITAISVVFTFCFQLLQTKATSEDKQDVAWRAALDKVTSDEKSADIAAFEVQTFAENPRYRAQARTIEATLLPILPDKYEFDAAFFLLLKDTDKTCQSDILVVARNESNRLRDLYHATVPLVDGKPTDDPSKSFENFVLHPDAFFTEDSQQDKLNQALVDAWKLDSVTAGLSSLWNPKNPRLSPGNADLSGIVFLNNDFSGVDFSQASMDDVEFFGSCSVERAKFPTKEPHHNCHPEAK